MSSYHHSSQRRAVRPSCTPLEERALLNASMPSPPAMPPMAATMPMRNDRIPEPIITQLSTATVQSVSTVPTTGTGAGGVNPYGVANGGAPTVNPDPNHPSEVPLKGTITIVPAGVPEEFHFPILTQIRFITGQVSHLGRTEGVIVQNINVTDLSFSGEFTLYAANGDSITGEVTGNLLSTDDPNILKVDEDIVITGGTGRFAGSTGTATGEGQAFRNTGRAEETFRGTISSPGL